MLPETLIESAQSHNGSVGQLEATLNSVKICETLKCAKCITRIIKNEKPYYVPAGGLLTVLFPVLCVTALIRIVRICWSSIPAV